MVFNTLYHKGAALSRKSNRKDCGFLRIFAQDALMRGVPRFFDFAIFFFQKAKKRECRTIFVKKKAKGILTGGKKCFIL